MKKIIISLSMIAAVAAVAVGATTAFFSDTETSTGNTFTAGAIDLKIDNESYWSTNTDNNGNLVLNEGTSWLELRDLTANELFFNFSDLKPGDWGEDTISLHVNSNDAYACVDVRLDSDDDVTSTEPELEDDDENVINDPDGELAEAVNFIWWVDDGDNVLEDGEKFLPAGPLGNLNVGQVATIALATPNSGGIFGGALSGTTTATYYIGKAWCFGDFNMASSTYAQDGENNPAGGPIQRPVVCNGSGENNKTQTDSMIATISFYAEQARNNDEFVCSSHLTQ